jgi:ABC-type Fe3+ transport system permease subunit
MQLRNLGGGILVAVLLAVPFVVPTVAGISTWKYLLGAIGLVVFVRAGMSRPDTGH